MKHDAFTLIEFVFTIVVIGILSINIMPQLERDNISEAAYQIARHLRLTQHHALVEDMFDGSDRNWVEKMWRIRFIKSGKKQCYVVFADRNKLGNANDDEVAVDTLTKKPIYANNACSESLNHNTDTLLWKKFGVNSVSLDQGFASRKHIAFDHLGRPLQIVNSKPIHITSDCLISIQTNNGHTAEITIYRESGFVKVTKIDNNTL